MFCVKCGKEFVGAKNARYCVECKEELKKENLAKMSDYVKRRNKRLGLANISIYNRDRDILKTLAKEKDTSIAEVLKELLAEKESKYN